MTRTRTLLELIASNLDDRAASLEAELAHVKQERAAIGQAIDSLPVQNAQTDKGGRKGRAAHASAQNAPTLPGRHGPPPSSDHLTPDPCVVSSPAPIDAQPTSCGNGTKRPKPGTNMELAVDAIRGRAPHWLTVPGIAEAIVGLGLRTKEDLSDWIVSMLHAELRRLRHDEFNVSGLEFKAVGNRHMYRMVPDDKAEKPE